MKWYNIIGLAICALAIFVGISNFVIGGYTPWIINLICGVLLVCKR